MANSVPPKRLIGAWTPSLTAILDMMIAELYKRVSATETDVSGLTSSSGVWGSITGTLASQTDLAAALALKEALANKDAANGYAGLGAGAKLPDGTLSTNVPLINGTNAFTGANSFATNAVDLIVGQLKFPATQNASANANTLDDYEEGTWTPTDASGAGLVFAFTSGTYIKCGGFVMAHFQVVYPATASGLAAAIGGLPFTVKNAGNTAMAVGFNAGGLAGFKAFALGNSTQVTPTVDATGAGVTNLQLTGANIIIGGTYLSAA